MRSWVQAGDALVIPAASLQSVQVKWLIFCSWQKSPFLSLKAMDVVAVVLSNSHDSKMNCNSYYFQFNVFSSCYLSLLSWNSHQKNNNWLMHTGWVHNKRILLFLMGKIVLLHSIRSELLENWAAHPQKEFPWVPPLGFSLNFGNRFSLASSFFKYFRVKSYFIDQFC